MKCSCEEYGKPTLPRGAVWQCWLAIAEVIKPPTCVEACAANQEHRLDYCWNVHRSSRRSKHVCLRNIINKNKFWTETLNDGSAEDTVLRYSPWENTEQSLNRPWPNNIWRLFSGSMYFLDHPETRVKHVLNTINKGFKAERGHLYMLYV